MTQTNGPTVYLPNMDTIQTTHMGKLPFNTQLSNIAITANVLLSLKSASLISLGQLCDDNCNISLDKRAIKVYKNNKKILQGPRNYTDGLWDINIPLQPKHTQQSMSVIIQKNKAKKDLIQFYHAACFSPSVTKFYKAVKNGNFQSWPGLTPELLKNYISHLTTNLFQPFYIIINQPYLKYGTWYISCV